MRPDPKCPKCLGTGTSGRYPGWCPCTDREPGRGVAIAATATTIAAALLVAVRLFT